MTGTGTARAPRRRSPQPRLRSVQPKDPPRLGGPSRRCTARPLNLPGDSDAGMARKAAGKSGVRAPGAREQRSPPRLGTALPVPGAERAIGRAPGPGVLPTWPRRHGVGSDSRRGPYRDGGHAGSGQLRGLREPGRGGDEGGGTVRRPEPSAPSAGASRSLQQRRPNQSPRSRRGQTSPETPAARRTADGPAGTRPCGFQRSYIAEPACIRGGGSPGWCAGETRDGRSGE